MSEFKGTPGTWRPVIRRDEIICRGNMHLIASGGLVLAFVAGWKDDDQACRDEADANARLLAAAPDLLAACQAAEWNSLDLPEGVRAKIQAAIQKALGQ